MTRRTEIIYLADVHLEGEPLEGVINTLTELKASLQTDKRCLKQGDTMYHSEPTLTVDESYGGGIEINLEQRVYTETLEEAEKRTIKQKEHKREQLKAELLKLESEL